MITARAGFGRARVGPPGLAPRDSRESDDHQAASKFRVVTARASAAVDSLNLLRLVTRIDPTKVLFVAQVLFYIM